MALKDALLFYSVKYDGQSKRMHRAVLNHEPYELIQSSEMFITIFDEEYPDCFKRLASPPLVLYYRGDVSLLKSACISVIGSRDAKEYAIKWTKTFVSQLASTYTIVSGLAKGIDGLSHQVALEFGKTIAVLGFGLDRCYPLENRSLFKSIEEKGLLISEYPNGSNPERHHFPQRNRLIAALGDKLLVMQARIKSGTMITVETALNLGKDIYVLPYRLDDTEGEGCNLLIEQGANLLTSSEDSSTL